MFYIAFIKFNFVHNVDNRMIKGINLFQICHLGHRFECEYFVGGIICHINLPQYVRSE